MINVVYHRELLRVSVQGHAQSGEKGYDLVCASASILVHTLASLVRNMEVAGHTKHPTINVSEGDAVIYCKVKAGFKATVTFAFDAICAGFDLLAKSYPDNISYEIRQ